MFTKLRWLMPSPGWALAQGIAQVFPVFGVPNWVIQLIVLLIVIGFPIALVLAWAFELTGEGTKTNRRRGSCATARKNLTLGFMSPLSALFCRSDYFSLAATRLRPTQHAAVDTSVKSIAVLPFENLSDDKQNTYFADGVQDQILTNLARVSDLRVISHTTVRQYKSGEPRNLREIGQQLGVTHILEGSVQRAGDRLRIAAQLIDARTDSQIWAETYDRTAADLFAIQSELAESIVAQLQAKLSPATEGRHRGSVQLRIWSRSSFTFAPSKSWTAILIADDVRAALALRSAIAGSGNQTRSRFCLRVLLYRARERSTLFFRSRSYTRSNPSCGSSSKGSAATSPRLS